MRAWISLYTKASPLPALMGNSICRVLFPFHNGLNITQSEIHGLPSSHLSHALLEPPDATIPADTMAVCSGGDGS
jgi:hypothetical protein